MRAYRTIAVLWLSLAIHGCALVASDPPAAEITPIADNPADRCPDVAAADRAALRKKLQRPGTPLDGATTGDLKLAVDQRDVFIEELRGVGRRAHRELDNCRGVGGPPSS